MKLSGDSKRKWKQNIRLIINGKNLVLTILDISDAPELLNVV
jgi:hypothetical protein